MLANELHESILDSDKRGVCMTNFNLGIVSCEANEFSKAHAFFNEALKLQLEISGADSLEVAKIHGQIGKKYLKEKNYTESLHFYKLAYETEKMAATDYAVAGTAEKIGNLHLKMSEDGLAIVWFEEALALKRKLNATVGKLLYNLGEACINTCNFDKALEYSNEAWKTDFERDGNYHQSTLNSRCMTARIKVLKVDYEGALADYEEILKTKREMTNSEESKAITLMDIGHVCLRMNNYSKSQENFDEARKMLVQIYGYDERGHPTIELVEKYIAELNEKKKDKTKRRSILSM